MQIEKGHGLDVHPPWHLFLRVGFIPNPRTSLEFFPALSTIQRFTTAQCTRPVRTQFCWTVRC